MNGWILKRAVKKPAIDVNKTENTIQSSKARSALPNGGSVERLIKLPKTVPVFGPLCIITVATIFTVMGVSGHVTQFIVRRTKRGDNNE